MSIEMPPPAMRNKAIRNVMPDDLGWLVKFECGHMVWFAIEPETDKPYYPCSVCVSDYLNASSV